MSVTPEGIRQDVITYTVKDRAGMIRDSGAPLERAQAVAEALAEDMSAAPVAIERVTYVAFTHREVVQVVNPKPEAA